MAERNPMNTTECPKCGKSQVNAQGMCMWCGWKKPGYGIAPCCKPVDERCSFAYGHTQNWTPGCCYSIGEVCPDHG